MVDIVPDVADSECENEWDEEGGDNNQQSDLHQLHRRHFFAATMNYTQQHPARYAGNVMPHTHAIYTCFVFTCSL